MGYSDAGDVQRDDFYDIHEWNLDKSVKPHVMVRGMMGKDTGATWRYLRVSASGAISNDDAANFRVSSLGGASSPLSADSSTVSALQEGANRLRISAFQTDAGNLMVSGKSGDAALFRVSGFQGDAANLRVSAIIDNGSISAKSSDAGTHLVSAKQGDAGLHLVSAKQGDAGLFRISAIQGDAGLLRISSMGGDAGNDRTSALQADASLLRVSGILTTQGGLTFWTSAFDIASTGGVAVVNGVASTKIYLYGINMTLNASNGIKWQSGSTDLQGITRLSASAGYVAFVNPPAYVIGTTSAGQDLNLNLSATGTSASGWVAGWSQ